MKAKYVLVVAIYCSVISVICAAERNQIENSMELGFRVVPHENSYFLMQSANNTDETISLGQSNIFLRNSNTLIVRNLSRNRPNTFQIGPTTTTLGPTVNLNIDPGVQYQRLLKENDRAAIFLPQGYMKIHWSFGMFTSSSLYIGFPDEDDEIAPPVVDRPLRHRTRKDQIALAFIFNENKPRELAFLVMNKLDETFVAFEPLSAKSRILVTSPAIGYRREVFIEDKEMIEREVPSGEVAEWRLPWTTVLEMIPEEDQRKIIEGGGDVDFVWQTGGEESTPLRMHIAPPETFKDSELVPHPEKENIKIIADPEGE